MSTATAEKLEQKIETLGKEVARLRAIVDWEKALENVPYDRETLSQKAEKKLIRDIERIRSGKDPVYHFDPESFRERIAKERKKLSPKNKRQAK